MASDPRTIYGAYLQVNLVDGYGFLDSRGALWRQFGSSFGQVTEGIDETGPIMQFSQPTDSAQPVLELRLSVRTVWMQFRPGVDRVEVRQEGARVVDRACALIGATRFSRLGLRLQAVLETEDVERAVGTIRRALIAPVAWEELGRVTFASATVQVASERFKATLDVRPVRRVQAHVITQAGGMRLPPLPEDDLPSVGMLVDVDVYDDDESESGDPKPHLNRAVQFFDERVFPLVIQALEVKQ